MKKNLIKLILISTVIVLIYNFFFSALSSFTKARLISKDIIAGCVYNLSKPPKQVEDIVVVSIDLESLRNLDYSWPWTRRVFAEFISKLKEYNPRVVYLDFSFIGESLPEEDDLLAKAIEESGNVLIPFYLDSTGMPMFPLQKFMEVSDGFAVANKLKDIDLSVRDMSLVYFSPEGRIIDYSIELIILSKYLGVSLDDISFNEKGFAIDVKGKKKRIPLTNPGILHINYSLRLDDINVVPFWKVLKEQLPKETFKDKIVIVGITDKTFIDTYPTPLGRASGVEIAVNTLLTMLSGNYIYYSSNDINPPLLLLMAILISFTIYKLPPLKGLIVTALELLGYFLLSIIFSWFGWHTEIFSVFFLGIIIYMVAKIYKFIFLLEEQNIDLQKALKDLKKAEAELIESEKLSAVGRLSAQISHEIKNPLCTIQNNVELIEDILARDRDPEKIKGVTKRISGELNRLAKLSYDILGFARPSREELKPVDINIVINDIIELYRSQLAEAGIEIYLNLDKTLPETIAPSDKLRQVFSNLTLNVRDAMSSGGKLTITTSVLKGGFIEASFSDTGCGMSKDVLKKIFEPFFTTKKDGKGTGLGLYTVQSIVKGLGGNIDVRSTVGKGTIFNIRIPIKR